jgi:hypothetical protein
MKKALSSSRGHEKFTKALASVLSASPKQIQDSRAQAKAEKPSPHTSLRSTPLSAASLAMSVHFGSAVIQ